MSDNPYASPPQLPQGEHSSRPESSREVVRQSLYPPAMALLVLSTITILIYLGLLVFVGVVKLMPGLPANDLSLADILGPICILLTNAVVCFGSVAMLRMSSYGAAYTAAIIALIPFCTPCWLIGIPFGIWALVLLNRYGTSAVFDS